MEGEVLRRQEVVEGATSEGCPWYNRDLSNFWYIRYPFKALFWLFWLMTAISLGREVGVHWLVSFCVFLAIWWARESIGKILDFLAKCLGIAILFLIAGGVLYLCFGWLASLPTSVAIILGAWIIASSRY
jgi:apolipoprotein N-acyltransferase